MIEPEPAALTRAVSSDLRRVAAAVARAAVAERAPILSLQAPAQGGGHSYGAPDDLARSQGWPLSQCWAVRFSIASGTFGAAARLAMANDLGALCRADGFGFWLADRRPGQRSGNWFAVVSHDKEAVRKRHRDAVDGKESAEEARYSCPVTLVGPARVGSTDEFLRVMETHRVGLAALSITSLDDLAFIHARLVLPFGRREGVVTARASLRAHSERAKREPAEALRFTLDALQLWHEEPQPTEDKRTSLTLRRAFDYSVYTGPIEELKSHRSSRPLWFAWGGGGSPIALERYLTALSETLTELGLLPRERGEAGQAEAFAANVEYLLCRRRGGSIVAARGKLAVPDQLLSKLNARDGRGGAELAARTGLVWRGKLELPPGSRGPAVAWRESLLE